MQAGTWKYRLVMFLFNRLYDYAIDPALEIIADHVVSKVEHEKIKKQVRELEDAKTPDDIIDAVNNLD